ncbi:probable leucine-rich repeat receptor-like protein kinase At5g49770 isoform X2 [Cryptomeria japonica]|uniref:probable leucine-rich repeat receptor-like protein kinase At5g49770 isoform X2 n=1 Tax=Cryptomeria japonica TaxID=3369 RepID=UPI0027D9EA25|nr:probable leucine-rich repeat receptor-like protein kinase At5g49770 isoform X2 [Cryptomeria japonica]
MAEVALVALLYLLLLCYANGIIALTDGENAAALRALKSEWQNTPPNWNGPDPCGTNWEGVICTDSKVTSLSLSTMNLKGRLASDIGCLSDLRSLDLSYNKELTGPIPNSIGQLLHLDTLIMIGCAFTGSIPDELGSLLNLTFLALNSNKLSGEIPASIGNLNQLYWLDIADNQIGGSLPVSTATSPGLDKLTAAKHFHFNKNHLVGQIPPEIFNEDMKLIHVLLDSNRLTGNIPETLGLVSTLEVLRLDRNSLEGSVPLLTSLTKINELHLSNNKLEGSLPDLFAMRHSLNYVDLSNNSFTYSVAPAWLAKLESLTTLVVENGGLEGQVPPDLFGLPQLQTVRLRHNSFNNTLKMDTEIGPQLQYVDFEYNEIQNVAVGENYNRILLLLGNPACEAGSFLSSNKICKPAPTDASYKTSLSKCGTKSCHGHDQKLNPATCACQVPLTGELIFRSPSFSDLSNASRFQQLEASIWRNLSLPAGEGNLNSLSLGAIVGIAVASALVILLIFGVTIYALKQKRRAEKALEFSKPFASWGASGGESGAPKLKGARWFSFQELKMASNNFSEANVIGSGGYGKVYKGILTALGGSEIVAIKRAQQGSMQGGTEFKNEIELLSRVHHKNLVGLIGFCFEQGEQMLVYEYMSNGTLRDSLSGRTGIYIDWRRRVRIALGSAKGLSYLHEHANPPIIHRDVKSTNILLDGNLTAKVADFGLSKLVADGGIDGGGKGHVSTQVKGTLGYLDPEYYMTQQLSEKSDVYSFGVVLMEILTARQPIERGKYIVREVKGALETEGMNGVKELLDPLLIQLRDLDADSYASLPGLESFVNVAVQCVEEAAADRPTMSEVVKELEAIVASDKVGYGHDNSSSSVASDAHPYAALLKKGGASRGGGSFDYSGGFSVPSTVEPK